MEQKGEKITQNVTAGATQSPRELSSALDDPFGLVGKKIDNKYLVEAIIASGGFSVVYRANHLFWNRPVAIKAFRGPSDVTAPQRAELLEAFVREGALLAELAESSLGVCQARDLGSLTMPSGEWVPYLVLEWLEGDTLEAEVLAGRDAGAVPQPLATALALLSPAFAALSLAHEKGICHLDLKPGNLFLRKAADGTSDIKLIDFGAARVLSRTVARDPVHQPVATPQFRSFTPAYGTPEQFDPRVGPTGPWTDVFALALILVELVTGREPLPGVTPSEMAGVAIDPGFRPTPRNYGALVSDEVENVFLRALAIDPLERFATAGEFWAALDFVANPECLTRMIMSSPADCTIDVVSEPQAAARHPKPSRAPRLRARAAWMTAAVMVLGTALEVSAVAKKHGVHVPLSASAMAHNIVESVLSH